MYEGSLVIDADAHKMWRTRFSSSTTSRAGTATAPIRAPTATASSGW